MNKKLIVAAVVTAMTLAGCQQAQPPQKAPDEMIQDGMKKLSEIKASSFEMKMKANFDAPEAEAKPAKISMNFNLKGNGDMVKMEDPKLNMMLDGDIMADAEGGSMKAEIRMNKDAIFANLMSLDVKGGQPLPEDVKKEVIGKWWKLPIPEGTWGEVAKSMPAMGDTTSMTPEQKKVMEAFKSTKFFKDAKFVDYQTVMGEESAHYTVALDKDATVNFLVTAAEAQGKAPTAADKDSMKKFFDVVDFAGNVYVGKTSGAVTKIDGSLNLKGGEVDGEKLPKGTIAIEFSNGDFGKAVTVAVPAEVQAIPLQTLSALAGMAAPAPVMMDDSMTMPADSGMMISPEEAPVQ